MTGFTVIQTVPVGEICPKCYAKTVLKLNSKTGENFVGCENYPECNFTSPYMGLIKTKVSSKIRSLFFTKLTKDAPKNMSDEDKIVYCDALGRCFYNKGYDEVIDTEFIWTNLDDSIAQWQEVKATINVDKIYYALKRRLIPKIEKGE